MLPLAGGAAAYLVKCHAAGFCLEVGHSTAHTHWRECYTHGEPVRLGQMELEVTHHLAASHIGEVVVDIHLAPEAGVLHALCIHIAILADGFRKGDCKVGVVLSRPAVGDAIACEQGVVDHAQIGPQRLSLIIIYACSQVENELPVC